MTAKSSIRLSDGQSAFARRLVEEGRYPSVDAVVDHGLELLRVQSEAEDADREALRTVLDQRRCGPFVSDEAMADRVEAMLTARQRPHGLAD